MADQWWNDDDQLLEVLRDALAGANEIPPSFVDAGKAAYAWRTIDADLAALTFDSAWDSPEPSLTRATESATLRRLTFATDALSVELELTPDELLGQLSPPDSGTVRVTTGTDDLGTVPIDELGFFVITPVPHQPFQLVCHTDSGTTVRTGWVSP